MVERQAQVAGGLDLRLTFAFQIGGPLWAVLGTEGAVLMLPPSARVADFPLGASLGFAYRFEGRASRR